jgi:group I intron endonuclease
MLPIQKNVHFMWNNFLIDKSKINKTLKNKAGVYMLLCNTSAKYYIGSSINLENRLKQYYSPVVRQNEDFIIYRALNKYGLNNFSLIILEICEPDRTTCLVLEQLAFEIWKPEYNILTVAGSPIGFVHSDETRALMSALKIGEKNAFYGKTHTLEVKQLLKELNSGENHPNYGKKRSTETIHKIMSSSKHRAKPVYYYKWEDKTYLGSFPSINQMAKELNLVRGTIQYCIKKQTPLTIMNENWFISHSNHINP